MKKVLIVTDLFHASPRIPGLCKYIRDLGWEPVLLTTPLGENPEARMGPPNDFTKNFRVIEVHYESIISTIKKLMGFSQGTTGSRAALQLKFGRSDWRSKIMKIFILWGGAIVAYPDELRAWRKPAIKAGRELVAKEKFDAILSSSSPVTSHRIARALKKSAKLPWAADLRDLWTQNHNYMFPEWRRFFETCLEIKTLKAVNELTTVSDSLVHQLQSRYGAKPVTAIQNGFDPALVNDPPVLLTEKFTISYTGTIYRGKQNPEKLFIALAELISSNEMSRENIRVRFYGASLDWLQDLVEKYQMGDIVKQYGYLPRQEVFKKQRESQVLLMFGWEDETEVGVLLTKSFEYLAARRPILISGGTEKEQLKAIMRQTKSGRDAIDIAGVKKILSDYYSEYLKTGAVSYHGNQLEMDKYSYREMARKFVEILDRISS